MVKNKVQNIDLFEKDEKNEDMEKSERVADEKIDTIIQNIINYNNFEDLLKYIEELKLKISSASKSITSIPKALKTTLLHFDKLLMFYQKNKDITNLVL